MQEQRVDMAGGPVRFEGAVSLEVTGDGVRPWRLPFHELSLFSPALVTRSGQPSGVRLTFFSDTTRVRLEVEPPANPEPLAGPDAVWTWDALVEGRLAARVAQPSRLPEILFENLAGEDGPAERRVEIYLPSSYLPVRLHGLYVDGAATVSPWNDPRKRFVVYGSSITQAKEAAGPSETWAAIVCRDADLHLTNLGFGGNEHIEAGVARVLRDLPADYMVLCLGGNVHATTSLSARTYMPAVIDMVRIIRERHPTMPLAVISAIHLPDEVGQRNLHDLELDTYREWTGEAVQKLRDLGDARIFYVHGPDLYGPDDASTYTHDGAHPDEQGQRLLAERFLGAVMPSLTDTR